MKYYYLFLSFLKIGVTGFGGGLALIPVIQEEVVTSHQWLSEKEFIDVIAFGNTLPGPITTKLAAFIGFKVGGILGSLMAIIGIIFPTAFAMIMISIFYYKFQNSSWMQHSLQFIKPVIFLLVLDVCIGMRNIFTDYSSIIVVIVAAIGLYLFRLSPAILILLSIVSGYIIR